ncbi:MAG: excinuclease ABC subunit A, partial [Rikenellaceae bacterium]
MEEPRHIYIKGARVHNLKNISLKIPHDKLVVVTGLSGSGKSTLAFDTIFAEGQRRYVESLSAYARQFLGRISKPDVDLISGIAPAIAIEQRVNSRNPRSTIGTSTEIYDYLKLLFSRIGHTYSPVSGVEVRCESVDDVVDYITSLEAMSSVIITSPLPKESGISAIEHILNLVAEGFQRIIYRGEVWLIDDFMLQIEGEVSCDDILVVIDRIKVRCDQESISRYRDSVSRAFDYGDGECGVICGEVVKNFSSRFEADGITFEEPTEHLFSFNNPLGACPKCEGYGKIIGIDEELVVPDKTKTIYEGAIACWRGESMSKWNRALIESSHHFNFPVHKPYYQLSTKEKQLIWSGNKYFHGLNDFFKFLESEKRKIQYRVMKARYTGKTTCDECGGSRLRREALYVKVAGYTIADLVSENIDSLIDIFSSIQLDEHDTRSAERILLEIVTRLQNLSDVGLGYLTLDRLSSTLSGGESQRINLSTSLGSNLTGSLYILDEPSIGLHPRDTQRLISV